MADNFTCVQHVKNMFLKEISADAHSCRFITQIEVYFSALCEHNIYHCSDDCKKELLMCTK